MGCLWKISIISLLALSSGTKLGIADLSGIITDAVLKENKMAECLLHIIRHPSTSFMVNIRIHIAAKAVASRREFEQIVNGLGVLNGKVAFDVNSHESGSYVVHGRFYFVDSFKLLESIIEQQRKLDDDISAVRQFYIVVLPVNFPKRILEYIFQLCWRYYIINVNVLIEDSAGVITLYTFYPFTEKSCRSRTLTIHNRFFNGSFERQKPIFPVKTNNLWQCPVRMVVFNNSPYVRINETQLSGVDVNIATDLSKVMNFSLEVVVSPRRRGLIYSKQNLSGDFQLLRYGLGDFVTGIRTKKRYTYFAATCALYFDEMRIFVKWSKRYSSLEILVFPFDWWTWIALSLVVVGKWISQVIWSKYANDFVYRSNNTKRLCILAWLLSTLILSSSYEGLVFTFLRNRPSKPLPKNLDDALDQGYKFIVSPLVYDFLSLISVLKNTMIVVGNTGREAFNFFDKLEGQENYAYIEFKPYMPEYIDPSRIQKYFVIHESVVVNSACAYFQQFSYLTEEFNKRLEQMNAHGHILKNYQLIVSEYLFQKKESNAEPKSLSLQKLIGTFQLLLMLSGLALVVFVLELISRHNRGLRMIVEVFE